MKLIEVTIHNIRSVKHSTFELSDYSMLIGENNAGKTNIFMALRLFYENGVKYRKDVDFPKFANSKSESWVELAFKVTEREHKTLKDQYKTKERILRVRRYFKANDTNMVKSSQSNIYAYESGELSNNLFYGARNVSKGKLGNVLYIPATGKTNETLKLSGSSPFRDILNLIMKRAVLKSSAFESLNDAFQMFDNNFREESSVEGLSVKSLVRDINSEIHGWGVDFNISIDQISPEEIVKTLLSYQFKDNSLNAEDIDIDSYGQGFQRHVIYSLIKLSAKYTLESNNIKKDFTPDFNLILFEEPEAFLHPSQQDILYLSLQTLSLGESDQVIVSSHSPHFVSKQISHLTGIVRLLKDSHGVTRTFQVNQDMLTKILDGNIGLYKRFCECLNSNEINDEIKKIIKKREFGDVEPDFQQKLDEEGIKYFLWLDSERSSMFFAKKVLICEGATEKIFFDYMFDEHWREFRERHVYVLDAEGKFSIHRYIALLSALGIDHSVLYDSDQNNGIHEIVNSFLESQTTDFTKKIDFFDRDLENFLEIESPSQSRKKPLNVMMKYFSGNISTKKLCQLKEKLEEL